MQVNLRISSTNVSFSFKLAVLFITFFKYHVVFQDRSEATIGEENIIDMI